MILTRWFLVLAIGASPLLAADAEKPVRRSAKALARTQAGVAGPQGGVAAFERVLTVEQREKLREATRANVEIIRGNQQEAIKLRRDLQEAVLGGRANEAEIQQKAEAISKLEAEALAARMNAIAQIAATLTPEQKQKIKEMSQQVRPVRPGLGAGARTGEAPRLSREPAAPPPPEK
jgi:Spy/CpxP family protein refolding chaperone